MYKKEELKRNSCHENLISRLHKSGLSENKAKQTSQSIPNHSISQSHPLSRYFSGSNDPHNSHPLYQIHPPESSLYNQFLHKPIYNSNLISSIGTPTYEDRILPLPIRNYPHNLPYFPNNLNKNLLSHLIPNNRNHTYVEEEILNSVRMQEQSQRLVHDSPYLGRNLDWMSRQPIRPQALPARPHPLPPLLQNPNDINSLSTLPICNNVNYIYLFNN